MSVPLESIERIARKQGADWLILTPHFWRRGGSQDEERAAALVRFQEDIRRLNAARAADKSLLLVPGIEETRHDPGHLGIAFFDMRRAWAERDRHGGSLALAAHAQGGLVVLNHPFGTFGFDMTWKPISTGKPRDAEAAAITERAFALETFNRMMSMGETILARSRDRRQGEAGFAYIEKAALESGRRLVGVGGSDAHNAMFVHTTTWAYVRGPLTEASLRDALLAGRIVCGNDPAATSFEASTDLEPRWSPPGASLRADREVRLRWKGKAELWQDGSPLGEFEDGKSVAVEKGSRHVFRIVIGKSFANPVFVNLPNEF